MRKLEFRKGLTLLGAMIALFIIAILAGCNKPSQSNGRPGNSAALNIEIASKQVEAKELLMQIYEMELAYYQDHSLYYPPTGTATAIGSNSERFEPLGVKIPPNARYTYVISGGYSVFSAVATCGTLDDDRTQDTWSINQSGELRVTSNDAADWDNKSLDFSHP